VGFESITEEEEYFVAIHSRPQCQRKLHSECPFLCICIFITEEKREEHRPHLLAGFSPILGFPGYILCSFVWMVCSFSCSFIFVFSVIFINLSNKLVIINLRSKEINLHNKIFSE
jgi:hypothetical protein